MKVRTPADIALLVHEQRRKLGVSQQALAHRIGASRQWVQNLEQGRPGLELGLTLQAIAALGLSLDAREPTGAATVANDPFGRRSLFLHALEAAGGRRDAPVATDKRDRRPPTHNAGFRGEEPRPRQTPARGTASVRRASAPPQAPRSLLSVDLDSLVSGHLSSGHLSRDASQTSRAHGTLTAKIPAVPATKPDTTHRSKRGTKPQSKQRSSRP